MQAKPAYSAGFLFVADGVGHTPSDNHFALAFFITQRVG
jgi:hypothetical protein